METTNFGTFLKTEREKRQLTLAEVSQSTKLSVSSLKLMEAGNLDDLPPDVFVRGFIRSYSKTVGISSNEPLGLLDQVLAERRRIAEPPVMVVQPPVPAPTAPKAIHADLAADDDAQSPRRGIGLAVFVIIVLLIATITLSLFLRQQPQSGEGLSLSDSPAPSTLLASRRQS